MAAVLLQKYLDTDAPYMKWQYKFLMYLHFYCKKM